MPRYVQKTRRWEEPISLECRRCHCSTRAIRVTCSRCAIVCSKKINCFEMPSINGRSYTKKFERRKNIWPSVNFPRLLFAFLWSLLCRVVRENEQSCVELQANLKGERMDPSSQEENKRLQSHVKHVEEELMILVEQGRGKRRNILLSSTRSTRPTSNGDWLIKFKLWKIPTRDSTNVWRINLQSTHQSISIRWIDSRSGSQIDASMLLAQQSNDSFTIDASSQAHSLTTNPPTSLSPTSTDLIDDQDSKQKLIVSIFFVPKLATREPSLLLRNVSIEQCMKMPISKIVFSNWNTSYFNCKVKRTQSVNHLTKFTILSSHCCSDA